jgi:hypothetical protein
VHALLYACGMLHLNKVLCYSISYVFVDNDDLVYFMEFPFLIKIYSFLWVFAPFFFFGFPNTLGKALQSKYLAENTTYN